MKRMKKLLLTVAVAVALGACQESLEEKAAQEALLYTKKNCPAQIAENMVMDSMTYETATRTLHYHYTLTGTADSAGLMDKNVVREALLAELKNTTSMQAYKEEGFGFAYTYRSQKHPGMVLYDVRFSQKDYSQK